MDIATKTFKSIEKQEWILQNRITATFSFKQQNS